MLYEEINRNSCSSINSSGIKVLTGCGSSAAASQQSQSTAAEFTVAAETDEAAQNTAESENSILVLYYSGTGHTKSVADMIAEDTGADEYEITPSQPYTEDDLNYSNADSRVNKEHEDESLQNIAFDSYDVPNWDTYNVVFVGYPIWWQDASWVMKSYVSHLDFNGKKVIPYLEFENVLGIHGIDEYIRCGGTMNLSGTEYNKGIFSTLDSTSAYIYSAIVKNIQHSLKNYQYGSHFRSLYELYEKKELTSAVNRVIEDMNYRFTVSVLTGTFKSHDLGVSAANLRRDRNAPTDILDQIDKTAVTERLRHLLDIRNKED